MFSPRVREYGRGGIFERKQSVALPKGALCVDLSALQCAFLFFGELFVVHLCTWGCRIRYKSLIIEIGRFVMAIDWESTRIEFKEWYRENEKKLTLIKDMYTSLVTSILSDRDEFQNPHIESRVKELRSCCDKFEKKYLSKFTDSLTVKQVQEKLTDLIGIRIICSYEDEIEKIAGVIKNNFEDLGVTDKTAKLKDNEFGYKGLHIDVALKDDRKKLPEYKNFADSRVEIQIRTQIQHSWSILDHKIKYKHDENMPYELKRSVNRLAAIFELADKEFIRIRDDIKNVAEQAIKEAQDSVSSGDNSMGETPLSFGTFAEFIRQKNPNYKFYEERLNWMFNEIMHLNSKFSIEKLTVAYNEKFDFVERYKKENVWAKEMNPYTTLRHFLYIYDKENFHNLLMPNQRENFDKFIKQEESESEPKVLDDALKNG